MKIGIDSKTKTITIFSPVNLEELISLLGILQIDTKTWTVQAEKEYVIIESQPNTSIPTPNPYNPYQPYQPYYCASADSKDPNSPIYIFAEYITSK